MFYLVKLFTIILCSLVFSLSWAADPWKGKTKFEVGKVDIKTLTLNDPVVTTSKVLVKDENTYYEVEAYALLDTKAENVYKVSLDYDHYTDFVPSDVVACHTVRTKEDSKNYLPNEIFVWTHMAYKVVDSINITIEPKYYLLVNHYQGVNIGKDYGIRWMIEKVPHLGWNDPVNNYFSSIEGSWYILPESNDKVFVRYFIRLQLSLKISDKIITSFIENRINPGVKKLILAIKNRAQNVKENVKL